ncbi:MAG: VOC family protein [Chloroflexota bacterium]|nr:VOC family protein [Chloroflexota bacterium]MDE2899372.1 VOC family protein [Chloroflexota bacterium]
MSAVSLIHPFLWFDGRAEEAARFYVSIFPNSRIVRVEAISTGPAEGGAVVEFELEGQRFGGVDGGPMYSFTPAVSFVVACETQDEIDFYWARLSDGGQTQPCGWLVDKFGLSWQVIPAGLSEIMRPAPSAVMEALLGMSKIDIAGLREAAEG